MLMGMRLDTATAVNVVVVLPLLITGWSGTCMGNILTDVPKSNPLGIDWSPAPSPEDGPPLSAGALRNTAYLPAEVGGIVGAYVLSICVVVVVYLVIKRFRRSTQKSSGVLDIEMVEPRNLYPDFYDPSPISPAAYPKYPTSPQNFSWPHPEKTDPNPYIYPAAGSRSPDAGNSFVDNSVVEADREMLQRDLEDIYAHVMEQEEAKAAGMKIAEMPPPPPLKNTSPVAPSQRSFSPRKNEKSRPSNITVEEPKAKSSSRASSLIASLKSPRKKGLSAMRISSPIPTPMSSTFPSQEYASDEEPLSPRYYTPPPPPPVPKDQAPYIQPYRSSGESPISPTKSIAEQLASQGPPAAQFQHRPNPSQISLRSTLDPVSATSATSQTTLFPPSSRRQPPYINTSTSTVHVPQSNNSSMRQLPLRQFEPAMASPSFASTTKTTVLERTNPLSPGLKTGGLPRTPWTAGAVPYSPYQPFTPMMPITPRLVTKEDRKAMKKAQGRAPVLEMIKSDEELFDSAY